ncbi:hypothetical protein ACWKSP_14400 [Micromonosporaceae bacterium Da 78-11]
MRDFVRELDLFDTGPHEAFTMLSSLELGVDHLVDAVGLLPTTPRAAAERARQAKKPGVRGDAAAVLSGPGGRRFSPRPPTPWPTG